MNVYDWDNTIYRGDSTFGLVLYLYRHYPATLRNLPRTAVLGLLYAVRIVPKLTFKESLFRMFRYVPDMEKAVEEYTSTHLDHIKSWYMEHQQEDDLVISASPEFLIRSFCEKTGIQQVIASPVDIHTGKYEGLNCHGQEKVRRFRELYPDAEIREFYSDSRTDTPLAENAEEAWLVKGDERKPW